MDKIQITQIPLHLVDEPQNAMRSDVWDAELDDLASSIEQFGLLQPVTLREKSGRYEIIAGHRRLAAHRKLGMQMISAIIREADDLTTDAMKVHENLYRADVNPVDQAIFLGDYLKRSNLTVPDLAKQVNRSEAWVISRLEILDYPDYLMEFVHSGKLSMATASLLNQIPNEKVRESYCRTAAIQGLSASRAKYWLEQAKIGAINPASINEVREPGENGQPERVIVKVRCMFDDNEYPMDEMMIGYYHPKNLAEWRQLLRDARASNEASPVNEVNNAIEAERV